MTESDEFVQLLLFKRGQLRKEVELHYVTELVHQSHGMSNTSSLHTQGYFQKLIVASLDHIIGVYGNPQAIESRR